MAEETLRRVGVLAIPVIGEKASEIECLSDARESE